MKKILTAINNSALNEKLKKENIAEIIGRDIQYKEGIIEILEKNKNIDLIIISENLPGEITIENLIENINKINEKIKIIYILEKENIELEKKLNKYYIYNIYYNNKITLNELIKNIKEKELKNEKELQEEIEILKNMLKENNIKMKKEKNNKKKLKENNSEENREKNKKIKNIIKINKIINYYKIKNLNKSKEKRNNNENSIHNNIIEAQMITLVGAKETGKTSLALKISSTLEKKNNKVLLVDMDFDKKDLSKILEKKLENNKTKNKKILIKNKKLNNLNKIINKNNKKIKKYNKIKNIKYKNKINKIKNKKCKNKKYKNKNKINIIKNKNIKNIIKNNFKRINKNIYLLKIKNKDKKYIENKKKEFIKELEKMNNFFDYLIIDTEKIKNNEIIFKIIEKSKKIYIVTEPQILRIKETIELLKDLKENKKIKENSLHIIVNKENKESIHPNIIKKIFKNISVINAKKLNKKII